MESITISLKEHLVDKKATFDSNDIIELIYRDHKPIKKLIEILKDNESQRVEKEGYFEEFVCLLLAHAKAEEQSLYIQMKDMKEFRMLSFEGDTEHAIAEQLIQQINATPDDDEWNAKVKVVTELVELHIEDEESEILKDVEIHMDSATRRAVGKMYTQIKLEFDLLNRPRKIAYQNVEHLLS
jgi:hemerythrin superfamily protein